MFAIIEQLVSWALSLISTLGYWGIFLTMALDTIAIPIPSEVVLPFGGFLAASGELNLWLVIFYATLSNVTGGLIAYFIGVKAGQPLLERFGKYVFIHKSEVNKISKWMKEHETAALFFTRMLPGIRTYSCLVIGAVSKVSIKKFIFYTAAGSLIWNGALAYFGYVAGANWEMLAPYFHKFSYIIAGLIIIFIIYHIYKHVMAKKHADA